MSQPKRLTAKDIPDLDSNMIYEVSINREFDANLADIVEVSTQPLIAMITAHEVVWLWCSWAA